MATRRITESGSYVVDVETDEATGELLAITLTNLTKAELAIRIELAGKVITSDSSVRDVQPLRQTIGDKGILFPVKEEGVPWAGPEYRIEVDGIVPPTRKQTREA